MAILEQIIYGSGNADQSGREILARSSGITEDCAQELVRLCEGWGAVPPDGLRRPVLTCFPLECRLPALPGELHTVIRIAQGLRPVFHAVVITSRDFQDFDHNPFSLVEEGVFLDAWDSEPELPRRTVTPGSIAPLVSPPPGPADAGSVDEAVRQMLANERLLLPLESPHSDSDRFLALVVAGMPRHLRRNLRLASWTPSGVNRYTLAATHKESASFASWQPFLMTSIMGKMDDQADAYLDELKRCLEGGDLAGMENLSRESRLDTGRKLVRTQKPEQTLSATVDEKTSARLTAQRKKPRSTVAATPPPQPTTTPATRRSTPAVPRRADGSVRRKRPRPRVVRGGQARRGFAVVLSLCILGAGAYYMWTAGHWTRLPGLSAVTGSLEARTDYGVVDVGNVYRAALHGVQKASATGTASHDENARQRGLELLHEAGQLLQVQGRKFLQSGEQTLAGEERDGVTPAPADRLQERGQVLARELRRLAMAQVSIGDQVDWQDLADMDHRTLSARYDSLVARRRLPGVDEPDLAAIDRLLRRLDVTTRQVVGLARLEALLAQDRWQDGWSHRVNEAVDALGAVRQGRARTLRDDAEVMARLKRAEHASQLAAQAYGPDYADGAVLTSAVDDILPALYRRVQSRERADMAPLVSATSDLYRGLGELADSPVDAERLAGLRQGLEKNLAVRFDPVAYGDHMARLRVLELQQLVSSHAEPTALQALLGSEQAVAEHLRFLHTLSTSTDADTWQELAAECEDPFLIRWANHELARLNADLAARRREFQAVQSELAGQRATLLRLAAAGGRCGARWCEALALTRRARDLADPQLGANLEPVLALADQLSRPPQLSLAGFTVRLEQELAVEPMPLHVELEAGGVVTRTPVALMAGPASPAGSGWVGTASVSWQLPLQPDQPVILRVRHARDDRVLAIYEGRWLSGWEPIDLAGLDNHGGVRLSCRLQGDYWQGLELPEIR